MTPAKNSDDCPLNNPMAVRAFAALTAAPSVWVGRMIEQTGDFLSRKFVGAGMIRLGLYSSLPGLRSGNVSPVVGSVRGGALPALSCQVWKCIVSVGPMLSKMRRTSGLVTRWASEA